jgi:hypothetical protein
MRWSRGHARPHSLQEVFLPVRFAKVPLNSAFSDGGRDAPFPTPPAALRITHHAHTIRVPSTGLQTSAPLRSREETAEKAGWVHTGARRSSTCGACSCRTSSSPHCRPPRSALPPPPPRRPGEAQHPLRTWAEERCASRRRALCSLSGVGCSPRTRPAETRSGVT